MKCKSWSNKINNFVVRRLKSIKVIINLIQIIFYFNIKTKNTIKTLYVCTYLTVKFLIFSKDFGKI